MFSHSNTLPNFQKVISAKSSFLCRDSFCVLSPTSLYLSDQRPKSALGPRGREGLRSRAGLFLRARRLNPLPLGGC